MKTWTRGKKFQNEIISGQNRSISFLLEIYMINIDVEREVVAEVEKSILCKNYEDICYEIGKFIENITSDIYMIILTLSQRMQRLQLIF
ncbi:hypothetical protein [Methanosarcina acetivorans]|uniref:hypothetical protein n=1 Tax=Methanosarcina acetivorans TaxID=2214 RepID=UPI00064F3041|nr:hypothetical protein [Methanosarcina acetivorans]